LVARKLFYTERKRLAETGDLGPLADAPSEALRRALAHLVGEASPATAARQFEAAVNKIGFQYLGWTAGYTIEYALNSSGEEEFLDLVEVVIEEGSLKRRNVNGAYVLPIEDVEGQVNDLFDRHRYGYRIENGQVRKIGSPALDETVVGPALQAVQRPGWEEAERRFREAIQHQRGNPDENDDALTAANAALEAALKAAGLKGNQLSALAKSLRNSDLVPGEMKGVPEALDALLKRSGAIRDNHGDAHGKDAGTKPVRQELVDLAINWTGAFIVYLSDAVSSEK
jgi:hypothetical protein